VENINGLQIKEPSPKKTRRPRKPTFANVSVNAPRSRTSRGKRTAAVKSPEKQFTSIHNPVPAGGLFLRPIPTLNPLAPGSAFGQHFAPTSEEDEEFKMTVGGSKKKRTFGVFQEAPGESPSGMLSAIDASSSSPADSNTRANRELTGRPSVGIEFSFLDMLY
jgi:hypothetical protein